MWPCVLCEEMAKLETHIQLWQIVFLACIKHAYKFWSLSSLSWKEPGIAGMGRKNNCELIHPISEQFSCFCWNTSLYMLELARSSLYVKVVDQRAIQASSPCKLTYRDYNHQGVPSVLHSNKRERQRNWSHIQLHFLAHPSLRKNSRDPNLRYNCQSCDTKVITNQVNVSKKAISRRQQYSRILPGHACKNIRSSIFPKKAVVIIILHSMEDKWKNF